MLGSGQILLRSPRYFRELEGRDPSRGDKEEGIRRVRLQVPNSSRLEEQTLAERKMFEQFVRPPPGMTMQEFLTQAAFLNCDWEQKVVSRGSMLYCMTTDASGRLHEKFETDTIIRICDVVKFARLVRDAAQRACGARVFPGVVGCEYVTQPVHPASRAASLPAFALKDRRFAEQAEVRLVLESDAKSFETADELRLTVPELSSVCRIHSPRSGSNDLTALGALLRGRVGPNDQCPCLRGRKFKRCCGANAA